MHSAYYPQSGYRSGASFGNRATSLALSLAFVILLVLMLIKMGVFPALKPEERIKPITLQLMGEPKKHSQKRAAAKAERTPRRSASAATTVQSTKVPVPPHLPWNVTPLSGEEFAAADISNKPSRAQARASSDSAEPGQANGDASGAEAGTGPHGEKLYAVDWYTRPTDAQLSFYLPRNGAPEGYGEVYCRMVERYHVEDCRELGETPGSGLARVVRQAAWQFLVRPPRIGDRTLIGEWVRIRIDFDHTGNARG